MLTASRITRTMKARVKPIRASPRTRGTKPCQVMGSMAGLYSTWGAMAKVSIRHKMALTWVMMEVPLKIGAKTITVDTRSSTSTKAVNSAALMTGAPTGVSLSRRKGKGLR